MADEWDGLPERPAESWWHWVAAPGAKMQPAYWCGGQRKWFVSGNAAHSDWLAIKAGFRYLGPCDPPGKIERLKAELRCWQDAAQEGER